MTQRATQKPNVLFIISDQHRHDMAGCYGNSVVRTPNIDSLARNGVLYENAYCAQPLCGPSRACTLTGTYSHTCNMYTHGAESVLPHMPTMGSLFREQGYRTAAIGKLHVRGEEPGGRDLGFDLRSLRYYTYEYQDYIDAVGREAVDLYAPHRPGSPHNRPGYAGRYNPGNRPCMLDEDLMFDNLVTDQVIGFLQEKRDKPFFMWCGLEKPHPEWSAPARFHEIYDPADMAVPGTYREKRSDLPAIMAKRWPPSSEKYGAFAPPGEMPEPEEDQLVRGSIAAYHATVSYLDWNIGRILDCLDKQGLRHDTLVIYTADHGDNLFEHGLVQKHCFYEGAVRVPLVFSCPEQLPSRQTRKRIVSLVDVLPTLLELVGALAPGDLAGNSLVSNLKGNEDRLEGEAFSDFYSAGTPERMIRTPQWKYIYSHGDGDQLYDLKNDPRETTNLAGRPGMETVRAELRRRIHADPTWDPDKWMKAKNA